ncbi:leucine-rich repeat domain-containing protein [Chryseobacterium salviniae]|uniref:Leucine-rich repeat domain-containing protein n=1 Tax=Chryseobacterium salviniae TaxID=3101750 RepID=A0ABU6HVR9_9FLAO|nr:leucine-rich repeat domain-containing protein [Chryseobacterium sp. T9W2-O]MEC3876488.1 leucine-rich repeat domain-containing protein [Chryseobacterium sp. T9W2-O]
MKSKQELKQLFENGDKPVQEDFWEWLDSYWHKEEKIASSSLEMLEKVIQLIVDNEFKGSFLSVTFPDNVKKIASGAYAYAGFMYQIREVIFNEGLEEIGVGAFGAQCIKKIKTPSTLKAIMRSAFSSQINTNNISDSLEEIILNEGLEIIGEYAFASCGDLLKDLYIPSSVITVGQNAFWGNPSIETVSAPEGLDLSLAGIPETAVITYR